MDTFSQDRNHLALSLSKAQRAIKGAVEDSKNPFFKSNYADLSSIWDACREALTDNELAVSQTMEIVEGKTCLITTLLHSSGQWTRSILPLTLKENPTPQEMGSAITYARRYALAAIVCVCPLGDDDDAEKAMTPHRGPKTMPIPSSKRISPQQIEHLAQMIGDSKDFERKILEYNKVSSLDQLSEAQFDSIIKRLQARVNS